MSLTIRAKVDIRSMRAVTAALEGVKQGVRNRVIKAALAKQARAAARDAKQMAPPGATGIVKKSIGSVYKSYRSGAVWVFVVGPRRGFSAQGPGGKVVASKVAHLAERGRKAVAARRVGFFGRLIGRRSKLLRVPVLGGSGLSTRKRGFKGFVFVPRVRAAPGYHFIEGAYRELPARRSAAEKDILAGIMREAARYAARGKSIYG